MNSGRNTFTIRYTTSTGQIINRPVNIVWDSSSTSTINTSFVSEVKQEGKPFNFFENLKLVK